MEKLHNVRGDILIESSSVFSYGIHLHTYYELTLYEPFKGKVSINSKDFEINKVSAVLICPSDFHEITVKEFSTAKFIKIGFNADVLTGKIPDFSIILTDIEKDDFLVRLFKEILNKSKDEIYIKLLINSIIHIMLISGNKIQSVKMSKGHKIALGAAKMLNEKFDSRITLEETAKQLSVTPEYLSNIFKQSLGISFSNYLISMRLQYAAKLIKNTEKSITQICYDVGYSNFSHFSRSFKRKYGLSPREYRNIKS